MEPSGDLDAVPRRRVLRGEVLSRSSPSPRSRSASVPPVTEEEKPEESATMKDSTPMRDLLQLTKYLDNTGSVARDHVCIDSIDSVIPHIDKTDVIRYIW